MTKNQKILIMTVGPPGIGKSTWAKQQKHPIVSPDAVRLAVHGVPFMPEAENFVWGVAKIMVRSLFGAGHNKVILDATNINKMRRESWQDPGWRRTYHVFEPVSLEELLARNADRYDGKQRDMVADVIQRMYDEYEPVTKDEED